MEAYLPDGTSGSEGHRGLSDRDQTSSDADQTAADLEQAMSDSDQESADSDQHAANRDQRAADEDQAASDEASTPAADTRRARSAKARDVSAHERAESARARSDVSQLRDENAARRDRVAEDRDAAARARDHLAAEADRKDAGLENGRPVLRRMLGDHHRAAEARERAAEQRNGAARDRHQAAVDRRHAGTDRAAMSEALAKEGVDDLTETLLRGPGLVAMQRELDRTARSQEPLVVAFVDVDGLKATNDTQGHPAGDDVLRAVARCITQRLRNYDVLTRYGGDEFVCSLTGQDASGVRRRFERIAEDVEESTDGHTITVGLAERAADESLDELIDRADQAMIAARSLR